MRLLVPVLALGILGWTAGCGGNGPAIGGDAGARRDGGSTIAPVGDAGTGSEFDGGSGIDGNSIEIDVAMGADGSIGTGGDSGAVGIDLGSVLADASPDTAADGYSAAGVEVGIAPVADGGLVPDAGAIDSATDTGLDAGAFACNAPSCYAELMKDCQPAGTCIEQSSGDIANQCYANGVKVIATINAVAMTMSTTVKNGNRICYELGFNLASYGAGATVVGFIKDGSGTTVATISDDVSGRSVITCTGGKPVILNDACDSGNNGASSTRCDSGTCNP